MLKNKNMTGHLCALATILIWGTTFISTKILLREFTPIEILFYRFCLGLVALTLIYPKRLKGTTGKQELLFAGAGLSGVTLYFLFENIALTYTQASNVGVIVSIAPFLTALMAHFFLRGERPEGRFYLGFAAAITGIIMITFNGGGDLQINPLGDLLAVLAVFWWALYSILTKKISSFGYHTILATRRIFTYGVLFMVPVIIVSPFQLNAGRFANPLMLFNMLFLGLGASALCFVSWNLAVKLLGAVKTSAYIYAVPVITIFTSVLVLHEVITPAAILGIALTLFGLFISEKKSR